MTFLLLPKWVCTGEKLATVVRDLFQQVFTDSGGISCTTDIFNSSGCYLVGCIWRWLLKMTKESPSLAWWHWMPLWLTQASQQAAGSLTWAGGSRCHPDHLPSWATPRFSGRARTHKSGFQSASWWLHWFGDSLSSTGCAQLHILFFSDLIS